jgi:hypothetical membrane protein
MTPDPEVPRWAWVPATLAPVAMIGGWTVAAALQPAFDPVTGTISALAATTATDPWVMTAGLALTGAAHVGTALGLRPLPPAARLVLALGGLATLAVAAFPSDTAPRAHGIAASVGFGALALWPALAVRRGGTGVRRPVVAVGATAVLVGLLGAFVVELRTDGTAVGLTERALAGAQALWPLVAVAVTRAER